MKRLSMLFVVGALGLMVGSPDLRAGQAPQPPAPELKKLQFLAGKWTTKGKMFAPGQPPSDWTSSEVADWGLGGRYLRTISKVDLPGLGPDEALELVGYDSNAKVYRFWRFASGEESPTVAEGNFEGKKLVLTSKGGETVPTFRITWEPREKTSVYFLLEMKMGDKFEKMLEGTSTPAK